MSPLMPWTPQYLEIFYNDCVFVHQIFKILLKADKHCFVIYIIFMHSTDSFTKGGSS